MSALAFEWSPTGPQKIRRAMALVLILFGAVGGHVAPRGHWVLMVAFCALTLGFPLALPVTYKWPWRIEHPVLTTIAGCWFLLQTVVFLIVQLRGVVGGPLSFALLISTEAFVLFTAVSQGLLWLRRRRRSPPRPGPPR